MSNQFELNKEFINELNLAIEKGQDSVMIQMMEGLRPADIAEIIDVLHKEEALYVYRLLDKELAAEVLVELEEDVREQLLSYLNSKEIAQIVEEHVESDDAADIVNELSEEKQVEVLSYIKDKAAADDIVDLISYDEDTAGGLMGKEFIVAQSVWTAQKALEEMRKQAEEVSKVYSIYVVNEENQLLGTLSLKALLFATDQSLISDLYKENPISVKTELPSEEVANIMEKYDMDALPVVDDLNSLIGRITIDDVVDVIKEEAEKDYQMASGLSDMVETSDSIWVITKARIPWLIVGMLGGVLGALVIGKYEDQIQIWPAMAFFIPLIAAMGGNVGVQASAIIVQGLANNSIRDEYMLPKLGKEFLIGLLNGIIIALCILSVNIFVFEPITIVVAVSLVCVMLIAGLFGTFIPLLLNKLNIDPAVATGPFITTLNDIVGLFIYFMIGKMMYPLF